jgi:sulfite reductase (NADPH) flavoprotein alpha-component
LEDALTKFYEISRLVPSVIIDIAQTTNNKELKKLINKPEELEQYCYGRDVLDLILDFNLKLSSQELIKNLRKLQPRLYSISSSFNYNQDEVHLTVSQVEYQTNRRKRKGVSSNYLSSINEDDTVEIFVDENISFRLPEDPHTPIIMIGAGTGVAPYRAFLQERSLADIKTKNWLFLGERNFVTDFLYQTEWLRYHKNGLLTKIDLAFSRDQEEKKYVQHKLLENSKEIYKWVNEGAIVYLCGDKNTMAKDVKSTLVEIFQNEGGLSAGSAADYLRKLRRDKQFQEDVY